MLAVDARKRLGDFAITARFETAAGATALFGSSGAGKTTIVNMIAGLVRPDRGRIMYRGRFLFDADGGVDLPPHRRPYAHVFQAARPLPHLSVAQTLEHGRAM